MKPLSWSKATRSDLVSDVLPALPLLLVLIYEYVGTQLQYVAFQPIKPELDFDMGLLKEHRVTSAEIPATMVNFGCSKKGNPKKAAEVAAYITKE